MSFGGGSSTQKTKVEPWKKAQPFLQNAMGEAKTLYDQGGMTVDPYTGNRVAPMSGSTREALIGMSNRPGNAVTSGAEAALLENLSMDTGFRDMDLIRGRVQDDVQSGLADMFAGGAINSDLAQGYATGQMAEALAGVEYDEYNNMRNRQLSAMSMAPQIGNMGRADLGMQLQSGGLQDAYNQSLINANMQQYYEGENADMDALMRYSGLMQGFGGLGSSGSQTAPRGDNVFSSGATGLGTYGALLGAGVASPAAIGGGILAGLGSLF